MAFKRMAIEIGMGTDIRGADYTKAAVRALRLPFLSMARECNHAKKSIKFNEQLREIGVDLACDTLTLLAIGTGVIP